MGSKMVYSRGTFFSAKNLKSSACLSCLFIHGSLDMYTCNRQAFKENKTMHFWSMNVITFGKAAEHNLCLFYMAK